MAETTVDLEVDFCPDLLNDPIQSKWISSLPQPERKPVCELYNLLTEFKADVRHPMMMTESHLVRKP